MSFRLAGVRLTHANGVVALGGLALAARRGECLAVIGPSGAGKTTLLRVLGAGLRPEAGSVEVLGQAAWALPARALRGLRAHIGTVHQSPPLPPRQRVVTAVLAGRLGQWPLWKAFASLVYPQDIAGARRVLAQLDLSDRMFDRCDRLSGGQLQRVGLARVIYQQPDLMLADEPVSALDPALAQRSIETMLAAARSRGATLVASLHAVDLALASFRRIVGLRDGEILFDLPAGAVSEALLRELYAPEGGKLPTQATEPGQDPRRVDSGRPETARG